MKAKFVVILVALLLIVFVFLATGHSQSSSYWLIDSNAGQQVVLIANIRDSYGYAVEINRVLDYQTGKMIYIASKSSYDSPPVMVVLDMPHK